MIAISSIYEYIDTGICTELTGPEGAYKLFELHVRLDKIITKMDLIIRNLERIAENQYYLYVAVKNMQPQIEKMAENIKTNTDKLNEIAVSTEVTKHISKAIEKNTAATAYAAQVTAYTAQVIERNQYYDRNSSNSSGLYDHIHMPKI
ncbi:MAG: hypothetical protein IJC09_02975 [Clostridia bacterium]|nr:hypothetical protein [Clostridia bacterium]